VRAVGGVEGGETEQPARVIVELRARVVAVDRPELRGEREE
jgi:hypothetical protein